jgi:hypothetical protein
MPASLAQRRLGALSFTLAGVLFVLYPAVRPWQDETTRTGAIEAMSSNAWIASHLFAAVGFVLITLGLLVVRSMLTDTPGERLATAGVVVSWLGAGLTLPYYGAETFGLHAMAAQAAAGEEFDLLEMVDVFRFGPAAATMFGLGLVGLAVGVSLVAAAIWRSTVLPRYAALVLATGFVLFLPQFFTPPAVRISHGIVIAIGAIWLAWGLQRYRPEVPLNVH